MSHNVNSQRLIAVRWFVRVVLNVSSILLVGNGTRLHAQVAPLGSPVTATATNTIASFTAPAGTSRMLIITASDAAATDITAVTFGGNTATEQAERTDGFAVDAIYTYALGTSASSTTGAITITSTNATHTHKVIMARVYENVYQTVPLMGIQSAVNTNVPAASTLTVNSFPDALVFDIFDSWKQTLPGSAHTPGSGQTVVHSVSALSLDDGYGWWTTSTKPGAASVSMSRSTTDHAALIHIAASIQPAFAVIGTEPPANRIFSLPGPFTLDVLFNNAVDPASVQTGDLELSGIAGAFVSGVTMLNGNTTARFTLSGISSEGTLHATIAEGAVIDFFGGPNIPFSASYFVRQRITVFPYFHTFPAGTKWMANQSLSLWQLAIATGPRGSTDTVAKANFYAVGAGNEGYLMSPPMNLPIIPNPGTGGALLMHFHVAYRAYTGGENDSLAVVLSTDGGLTFPNELWVKSRNSTPSLATLTQSSTAYAPSAASDWRYETVVLNAYGGQSNVVIAFRANSQFGNNCFIDNVRINLAEKLTTYTVNSPGDYPADGGLIVYIQYFGFASLDGSQGGAQHISMKFDGTPLAVSPPRGKLSRVTTEVLSAMPPHSSRIPGGTLYIASYTGRPPITSQLEFAPNSVHHPEDFLAIFTPNNVSDNRWWTVTYSGDDSLRAGWAPRVDLAILPGVSQADKLYLMERSERDTAWSVWTTRIFSNQLHRSSLRQGFTDVAVGSRTEYNPGIWNQLKGNVRVMLQGPYNSGTSQMNTALKSGGVLGSRFGSNVPTNAVDSIALEIRNAPTASASTIRQIQPAWLLRDGTIVNFADTTKNYIEFGGAPNGNYYLVVWHRNHLGVMSATPQPLMTAVPAEYNFRLSQSQAYGTNPMVQVESGVYAMYAGDANASQIVTASDANDVFSVLNATGYYSGDVNLSGIVTAADANFVFGNLNVSAQFSRPTGKESEPRDTEGGADPIE